MLYNVLTVAAETATDYGSAFSGARWSEAGRMMLFGMVMVFAVLVILWAILSILKLCVVGKSPKVEKPKPAPKPKPEKKPAPAPVAPAPIATDDGELIAVLSAAVAAYMASENPDGVPDGAFRVVSFRRVSGGRAWNSKR